MDLYADGGVIKKNPSPHGGTWAWCLVDGSCTRVRQDSGILLGHETEPVTNNQTEYMAVLKALEAMPDGWSGALFSDSKVTLGRVFSGWAMAGIPWGWKDTMQDQFTRLGKITPVLLDGHPTKAQLKTGVGKRGNPCSIWNVWCDQECARLAHEFIYGKVEAV